MKIARSDDAKTQYEYGCDLRQLYPWPGVADPLWGSAIASVRGGEATTLHSHDEEETFIILRGRGKISVDGETQNVGSGDVIYLPRNSKHRIVNVSPDERLEFLTIFWGSPEAHARMKEFVRLELVAAGDNSHE